MKKIIVIAAALFATSALANISNAANPHNLSNGAYGACFYCHMPHNANPAGAGLAPLWARSLRTNGQYTTYTSTRLSGANLGTTQISLLCLSCHDGVVGLGILWTGTGLTYNTVRNIAGRTLIGPNLGNDHPVGFSYPTTGTAAGASGLVAAGTATGIGYTLYGATNTVECASCHEPHLWSSTVTDPTYKFKRQVTLAAGLDFCTGCHGGK